MTDKNIIFSVENKINSLPEDLFSIKSTYLLNIALLSEQDIDSAVVKLGRASERLVRACLDFYGKEVYSGESFDSMIKSLSNVSESPALIIELRSVLKYRNLASHDTDSRLRTHDFDAALSSFCAAYYSSYNLINSSKTGKLSADIPEETGSEEIVPIKVKLKGGLAEKISGQKNASDINITFNDFLYFNPATALSLILSAVSSLFLLWAVSRGGRYNFFLILRITISISSVITAYYFFKKRIIFWILFPLLLILFNPVLPVSFSRNIWKVIDIAAMLIFLVSGYLIFNNNNRKK